MEAQALDWSLKVFRVIADGASVLLVAVGLATFFMREKIKQRLSRALSKDLEEHRASLAKDHAHFSAGLSREMESYRVSLIAESERLKAEQQLKTALALKLGERRYEAVCRLHDTYVSLSSMVGAIVRLVGNDPVHRDFYAKSHAERINLVISAGDVYSGVSVLLPNDLKQATIVLHQHLVSVLMLRPSLEVAPLDAEGAEVMALVAASVQFDAVIRRELEAFGLPPR